MQSINLINGYVIAAMVLHNFFQKLSNMFYASSKIVYEKN